MKEIKLKGFNNLEIFTRVFDNVKDPKGVVQIIHGMREHSGRYIRFAEMLEKNGYIVIAPDQRGHGRTAKSLDLLGHGENDIYLECVEDHKLISEAIKEKYPNLPLYIFAHSFGSMVAQKYIQDCHLADKVILCGTNNGNNATFKFGLLVSRMQAAFIGGKKPAKMIEKTNKKLYASKFERGNWLTRNEEIYDKYLNDPFCNALFPISFYKSLFSHMTKVNKSIPLIDKDLEIFLIAGDKDPVGDYSKNVLSLTELYKEEGLNAKAKIYKDARHELINETNYKEVDEDILDFFNER